MNNKYTHSKEGLIGNDEISQFINTVVVGADTENVIVANQNSPKTPNNDGIQFSYVNGSLENTLSDSHSKATLESKSIREHVIEILEGGNDAFRERENKYTS